VSHGGGLDLGPIGVYGDRVANFALQNADVLVVLGARLDTRQTGGNLTTFSTRSRKVMVDIDVAEITKLDERGAPVEVGLVMDVRDFVVQLSSLATMTERLALAAEWRDKIGQWRTKYGVEKRPAFENYVSPYDFLAKLNGLLPSDAIVAVDTGATLVWTYQTLRRTHGQRIFSGLGNSSMGYALPAAIGAAISSPHRPVICIVGDGGFQQNIQELVTARHYKLNIKVFVLNNSGYGIIKQFQDSYLGGRHVAATSEDLYGTTGRGLDFVAIAHAYDVAAHHISSLDQLLPEFVTGPGFAVYDVSVHEQHGMQPKTDFGNSLENMTPFLDSAADMVVPPPPQHKAKGWVKVE
jgi:acetolactate synthase-1/2/3 large subunit